MRNDILDETRTKGSGVAFLETKLQGGCEKGTIINNQNAAFKHLAESGCQRNWPITVGRNILSLIRRSPALCTNIEFELQGNCIILEL